MFMSAMVRIFSWGERWNECNGTRSIALLGNGIFYSISRDHKQPIKRSEFNKVYIISFISHMVHIIQYI
jgi:hypothetical protein